MRINVADKNSIFFTRFLKSHTRLIISILVGVIAAYLNPATALEPVATRAILGWNCGAIFYLAITFRMMFWFNQERIEKRACEQDEGRFLILILVIIAALSTVGAIFSELSLAKSLSGSAKIEHIILAGLTILTSWFFTHVMFAQHYAHDFYIMQLLGKPGGLEFPETKDPDYLDFLYFSCIIGTSAQTADVGFTSKSMRRTGLVHCVLAFFFNTTLLALTINIASGLF